MSKHQHLINYAEKVFNFQPETHTSIKDVLDSAKDQMAPEGYSRGCAFLVEQLAEYLDNE